jgi:aminoglycoside phosphotransferase family enzyme/predicted kinase
MTNSQPPADSQDSVRKLLSDPATFGGAEIRRIDTHGACVFLAGDRVIKIKRAVRYPFLDYSTLDKREAACRAELEVNRNFAPQLYRRIVPITRAPDGTLKLDGPGEPVEWAVEMARFDENNTLDHLADRGELGDALTGELAGAVAAMHERAQPVEPESWINALSDFIADNTSSFQKHRDLFPDQAVAKLDKDSRSAWARLQPLLRARGAAGLIRRGHGDLHLGNIAVLDGEPVAFDALEFDPVIAAGDVLYDLAFLLMDLIERNLRPAANTVLNGYFSATRRDADCDGIAALPFFMSLRAAIRAKVTLARLDLAAAGNRRETAQSAQRYFDLALELLIPAKPIVACTGGLSGTGKSLLARSLAPTLPPPPGALVLRSDVERKALYGIAEHDRLPKQAYAAEVSDEIYRILNGKSARIARAGYSVIIDAVFAKAAERASIEGAAASAGAAFRGVFLVADIATRIARIGGRGADASDADAAVAKLQETFDIGSINWPTVDASGSPEQTLRNTRTAMARDD